LGAYSESSETVHTEAVLRSLHGIAERLRRGIVQVDGRLCWHINVPDPAAIGGPPRTTIGVSGSDLYQGNSGIGVFLLEYGRFYKAQWAVELGHQCILQSLAAELEGPYPRIGLFTGATGVAWAGIKAGQIVGDARASQMSLQLLGKVRAIIATDEELDIIGGSAGVIIACANLASMHNVDECRDLALTAGARVLARSRVRKHGWSWRMPGGVTRNDLCGYAHGASGYAHAFLALLAIDGDSRWGFAAQRALEYEHRHAMPSGDWPDFRDIELTTLRDPIARLNRLRTYARSSSGTSFSTMRAWCHGAPGMLPVRRLALAHGMELPWLDTEIHQAEQATREIIQNRDGRGYSLCHGVTGNAECLIAYQDDDTLTNRSLVRTVMVRACETNGEESWPSGVLGQTYEPSLLVGEAGIGLVLLRQLTEDCENPLLLSYAPVRVQPEKFCADVDLTDELRRAFPKGARQAEVLLGGSCEAMLASSDVKRPVGVTTLAESLVANAAPAVVANVRAAFSVEVALLEMTDAVSDELPFIIDDLHRSVMRGVPSAECRFRLASGLVRRATSVHESQADEEQKEEAVLLLHVNGEARVVPAGDAVLALLEFVQGEVDAKDIMSYMASIVDTDDGNRIAVESALLSLINQLRAAGVLIPIPA
jgi:hypothetical protein